MQTTRCLLESHKTLLYHNVVLRTISKDPVMLLAVSLHSTHFLLERQPRVKKTRLKEMCCLLFEDKTVLYSHYTVTYLFAFLLV